MPAGTGASGAMGPPAARGLLRTRQSSEGRRPVDYDGRRPAIGLTPGLSPFSRPAAE